MRVLAFCVALLWSSPALAAITGNVIDATTKAPVADAKVTLQATETSTTTDAAGAFTLSGSGAHVVVAAKKGYFNASATASDPASGVVIELEVVPAADDPGYAFQTPWSCGTCHDAQVTEWMDSPMAKAGLNSWVYDIYDGSATSGGQNGFVYTRDSAHAAGNPASECAACHQPLVWAAAPGSALAAWGSADDAVSHGVSCEMCHKIADIDETKPNFPGLFGSVVRLSRPSPGWQVMYGSLGDVDYQAAGQMRASYQPQLGAAVCAACHQDKNDPDGDGDFEEPDGVISEPTYLEWKSSPYADDGSPMHATCADCHMKPTSAQQACSTIVPPIQRPAGQVRAHRIEGTTAEYLENAVSLVLNAESTDGSLSVDVEVTNDKTGHHVPTGVTVRNMLLVVDAVREADGQALEHTGAQILSDLAGVGNPEQGYYAGLAGKVYAVRNHGADGVGPVFYTEATGVTEDTRIAALATDATHYTFALPPEGGEIRVRARLIYRRAFRALVDAKQWTTDGHGKPLADLAPPHFGQLMEIAETTVSVAPGGADAGADASAGSPAATGSDSGGCGCRVGATRSPWSAWAGLLLALALVLRRIKSRLDPDTA